MTSRLFSIFRMFPQARAAIGSRPNSWAELALWRRFFQMKEEEDEEITEMILDVVGECNDGEKHEDAINSESAVQARAELVKEGYRRLVHGGRNNEFSPNEIAVNQSNNRNSSHSSREELNDYDFDIPMGNGSYVTRAQ